jgi:hypothetical protein
LQWDKTYYLLELWTRIIEAEIITGDHQGKHVLISRIPLLSSEDSGLPFVLQRKQFPVHPAFALTINKSQVKHYLTLVYTFHKYEERSLGKEVTRNKR